MSLVRCLSLRSVLRARHHRSSYSCLTHLHQTPREEEEEEITPSIRSYHSIIHQSSFINGGSALHLSRNHLSVFQSHPATVASDRFISTFRSSFPGSGDAVIDWLLQSAVSRAFELNNVADVLVSLDHLLTLLNSFTFSQWWVFIIVTSLLIRGITIPVMVDLLHSIARFFKSLGSDQGKALDKVNFKSPGVIMYTMLKKEFFGVKGSVIGQGIQVPVFWFSMGELRQNMVEILMSRLRGKMLSAELIKNGVLSRGRLVVVVGDGIGLEIQMFDLDFSLILKRRQISQSYV
ncbi:PREDICTED: mitochondrial inner membrane protein OXA1-like [Camelina sativa]|uniref:Mitochondrial inner membrane protein OXA1-like n=1 Tax=Camelina sativa TaxID=90675 RepID=A0ABM0ZPE4_CAMSA|nr:PREDICTED: mitochondrial inner membrane protein OXA1-like [Camelina sativa]